MGEVLEAQPSSPKFRYLAMVVHAKDTSFGWVETGRPPASADQLVVTELVTLGFSKKSICKSKVETNKERYPMPISGLHK